MPTIKWYHQVTGHPGSKRLYRQLSQRYYHRDLRRIVDHLNCDFCQRKKLDGKGYGFLPEREVRSIPFEECAVDLIGPWIVQVRGIPYTFDALTAIDTVTNLVEIVRVDCKTSDHIMRKFAQCWLACLGLHWKPLDAAIGRLLAPYRLGGTRATANKTTMY